MEEGKSLKEQLEEIKGMIKEEKEKKKEKSFWMPLKGRLGKQKVKKGWATICKVGDNRIVSFTKAPIEEQTYMLDGAPRLATPEDTLFYKGKPFIIQPSWSVKPFSPSDNLDQTIDQKYNSHGYKLLLNRIKNETVDVKKKMNTAMVWGIIILVIVGGYLAFKGGLFK